MDSKLYIKQIEIDESTTREQLAQEVVYQFMNSEKYFSINRCKDDLIDDLRERIRDKDERITELNKYIERLEYQLNRKRGR